MQSVSTQEVLVKRGLVIVAAILLAGGLVAFVASGSTESVSGPATTIQEAPPDTTISIPIHTTVTAGSLEIPGVRQLVSEGEASVTAEAQLADNRLALQITDGRDDDGFFTCVMDFDSEYEGRLQSVELLSNTRWTLCFGIYESMPVRADRTIKCVRCPTTQRLTCGSNPECRD